MAAIQKYFFGTSSSLQIRKVLWCILQQKYILRHKKKIIQLQIYLDTRQNSWVLGNEWMTDHAWEENIMGKTITADTYIVTINWNLSVSQSISHSVLLHGAVTNGVSSTTMMSPILILMAKLAF